MVARGESLELPLLDAPLFAQGGAKEQRELMSYVRAVTRY
jgi:hypothetical protein